MSGASTVMWVIPNESDNCGDKIVNVEGESDDVSFGGRGRVIAKTLRGGTQIAMRRNRSRFYRLGESGEEVSSPTGTVELAV